MDSNTPDFKNLIPDAVIGTLRRSMNTEIGASPDRGRLSDMNPQYFQGNRNKIVEGERVNIYHDVVNEKGNQTASIFHIGQAIEATKPYDGPQSLYFATNESTLDSEDKNTLAPMIEYLKKNPDTRITIEGHTDTQGNEVYNLHLSRQRAESTRRHLISELKAAGIENVEHRVQLHSFGSGEANLPTHTADNVEMQDNRAVDIHIHYDEQKIQQAKNIEHFFRLSDQSPEQFVISPNVSENMKRKIEQDNENLKVISGQGTVMLAGNITHPIQIDYQNESPQESLNNIRFLIQDDGNIKSGSFRHDPQTGLISAEIVGADGTAHQLASMSIPQGVNPHDIQLGMLDPSGQIMPLQLDSEFVAQAQSQKIELQDVAGGISPSASARNETSKRER